MTHTLTDPTLHPLLETWHGRLAIGAGARPVRVVFAEGDDPRVQQAAGHLVDLGITPVLVRKDSAKQATVAGVEGVGIAELSEGPAGKRIAQVADERGWDEPVGTSRRRNPVYLAAAMVDVGDVDACVAGSLHPTGEVIRAGIHVLGLQPGTRTLSSCFIMVPPDGDPWAFADCAVVPEPDVFQLADIAASTALTFETLTGQTPSVAMLSFSTRGSADHHAVHRVRSATALVRERMPQLAVDGEMQFDAALVESVGRRKAADSPVAGRANVFVFPNLSAGNIGYKIAERLGGAQAFGPILQGLRAPMNDLSRGCSVTDIVTLALISALQAQLASLRHPGRTVPGVIGASISSPPTP